MSCDQSCFCLDVAAVRLLLSVFSIVRAQFLFSYTVDDWLSGHEHTGWTTHVTLAPRDQILKAVYLVESRSFQMFQSLMLDNKNNAADSLNYFTAFHTSCISKLR